MCWEYGPNMGTPNAPNSSLRSPLENYWIKSSEKPLLGQSGHWSMSTSPRWLDELYELWTVDHGLYWFIHVYTCVKRLKHINSSKRIRQTSWCGWSSQKSSGVQCFCSTRFHLFTLQKAKREVKSKNRIRKMPMTFVSFFGLPYIFILKESKAYTLWIPLVI